MRQRCPLSPILFDTAIEILVISVRANKDIRGVNALLKKVKLALYSDDIVLLLLNPHFSVWL